MRKRNAAQPVTSDLNQLNLAVSPNVDPRVDPALLRLLVEQRANSEATAGGWDTEALDVHEGRLPGEHYVEELVDRAIADNEIHAADADRLDEAFIHEAKNEPGNELSWLNESIEAIDDDNAADVYQRNEQVAVLEGKAADPSGARYIGMVPTRPVLSTAAQSRHHRAKRELNLRGARLSRWAIDIGITLALFVVELIIISDTLMQAIRSDNFTLAAAYAVPALLLATMVPHVTGVRLANWHRGGTVKKTDSALLMGIGLWLAACAALAWLRAEMAEYRSRVQAARTQSVLPAEADISDSFNWGAQFVLWLIIIAGIGVAIILLKMVLSNPVLSNVIRLDNEIALRAVSRRQLVAKRDRILDRVEQIESSRAKNITGYQHYAAVVLPALRDELRELYRTTFINALRSPANTPDLARREQAKADQPGYESPAR